VDQFARALEVLLGMSSLRLVRFAYAWALAARQDVEKARERLLDLRGDGFVTLNRDLAWLTSLAFAARTIAILNDAPLAAELYPLLAPHADRFVTMGYGVSCYGSTHWYLGLLAGALGRHDDAVTHLETAVSRHGAWRAHALVAGAERDLAVSRALQD